jgi:hypothetical protein
MAIIVCKDCGKEFSTDARRCPHCGAKKPRAKSRLGVLLLIFFGLFVLAGVLNDNRSPSTTSNSPRSDARTSKAAWEYASVAVAEKNLKYALKDADSAEFRSVGIIIPKTLDTGRMGVVCGEVNARIGFGGYSGYKKFLVIAGIPAIDEGDGHFANLWNMACANKPIEYPPGW